ncbi:hypothetical protein [Prosthecobacter sp.]|uniref:hypothetical protein n=1 Tax=Prosthecobacter sp. TaxID=1965333 RepID=UPI0037838811
MLSRILSVFVLLGLTQCNKEAAPSAAQAPSGLTLVTEGASPHFQAVASKLEIGGASFAYAEEAQIFDMLGGLMDEVMKTVPQKKQTKLPPGFTFKKIFALIGLDSIKASGMSSREIGGGLHHQRSFVYTPQGRKGLLTLTGGPAAPLLVTTLAVKDTDLALEFPLHLKDWAAEIWPVVMEYSSPAEKAQIEALVTAPQPPLGLSYKQMAENLAVRIALIATMMPEQSIAAPGAPVTFPGVNAAIVIDRLGFLKDVLKQFLPMLQQPDAPLDVTAANGVITARFKGPMGPAPMDFQPSFQFDENAERLIIATRPGYLDAVLGKEPRLRDQPEFATVWKGLPTEGNGCLFVSKRFIDTVFDSARKGLAASRDPETGAALKLIDLVAKNVSSSQAVAFANLPDGVLTASNTSIPSAGPSSSLAAISAVAVMSSLAAEQFTKVQQMGEQMKMINNGKQVAIGLKMYAKDNNGRHPATLSELMTQRIITDPRVFKASQKGAQAAEGTWLYDATLTDSSPGVSIVLAAPFTSKGSGGKEMRAVVRNDGRAEMIAEEDFQRVKDYNLR